MAPRSRRATHAGSWYSSEGNALSDQLEGWLLGAGHPTHAPARAIIAPHAGYSYSGKCAGFAYKQVDPANVDRVFLLGPAHCYYLENCALSKAHVFETPIGNVRLDQEVYSELKASGRFDSMSMKVDEEEHSLEMHLPYIVHIMKGKEFTLVPVLVGSLSPNSERAYGCIFSQYLADPRNLFVISSDFCHWGPNFSYTPYDKSVGKVHEFIEWLDKKGMGIIENVDPKGFIEYFEEHDNTICGRFPIAVLLSAVAELQKKTTLTMKMTFVQYDQSDRCVTPSDNSVSYASAALTIQQ